MSSEPKPPQDRRRHMLEIASAVVLAIATVGSAWCAYQSSRWSGVQAVSTSQANAARTEAAAYADLAAQRVAVEVGVWVQYISAISEDNPELAEFLSQRFPTELKRANEEWLATEPLRNPNAPTSPFVTDAYSLPERAEAERLQDVAEQKTQESRDANQQSDDYVLLTVIFASVLFFAGISSKFQSLGLRTITLGFAAVVLIYLLVRLSTYPIY